MATAVNITTTFAGEFSGKYISAALLSASTINDGGVEVMPNVKYRQIIQKVATGDLIADATCDFDASSSVTLTESILEPGNFQVNLQLCKLDFLNTWQAVEMGYSSNEVLPPSFAEYLIAHVAEKVAAQNETNIWQGAAANAGEYDGFEALAGAGGSGVIAVAGAGGLTSANILAELQKVVDAIPNSLYGKPELKLYISPKAAKLYVQVLGGFTATIGANGVDNRGTMWFNNGSLSYNGVPIFVARGLSADKMFAAESTNLFFGTSLLDDWNEVRVIDTTETLGDNNCRVIMRFKAGVALGIPGDIVYYS
tara:strand:+ start:26000 stop:26929 length:930 start_codon:yes stop_codon:yes gene_type:complete